MAGVLRNIRLATGNFILHHHEKKLVRKKQLINLDEALTIGIVYKVNNEKVFNTIKDLTKALFKSFSTVLLNLFGVTVISVFITMRHNTLKPSLKFPTCIVYSNVLIHYQSPEKPV